MHSKAQHETLMRYRNDPQVRRLPRIEYLKLALQAVAFISVCIAASNMLGLERAFQGGLLVGWTLFVVNLALNIVIYDHRWGVKDVAHEWLEEDIRVLQRMRSARPGLASIIDSEH